MRSTQCIAAGSEAEASGVRGSLADSKETAPQSHNSKELDSANNLSELRSGILPQSFQKETRPANTLTWAM